MNTKITKIMRPYLKPDPHRHRVESGLRELAVPGKNGRSQNQQDLLAYLARSSTRTLWKPTIREQLVLLSLDDNIKTAFALPAIYSEAVPPLDYS